MTLLPQTKAACETGIWAPTWQRKGVVVWFRVKNHGGFLPGPRCRRSCPSTRTPERWQKGGSGRKGGGRDWENFPCTLFHIPQTPTDSIPLTLSFFLPHCSLESRLAMRLTGLSGLRGHINHEPSVELYVYNGIPRDACDKTWWQFGKCETLDRNVLTKTRPYYIERIWASNYCPV